MKKAIFLSILAVSIGVSGCSTSSDSNTTSTQQEANSIITNAIAEVKIEKMACVMACGGKIKTGLAELGIIESNIEFDFEMGREENIATIKFDKDKVSKEEIQNRINELAYKVVSIKIKEKSESSTRSSNQGVKGTNSSFLDNTYKMPNLLDLFPSL